MRKRGLLIGGLGLALLLLISRNFTNSRASTSAVESPIHLPAAATFAQVDAPRVEPDRSVAAVPIAPHPSLAGTDVNGAIRLDKHGRIVRNRDVRRLFDYYLSLRGRKSTAEIRAILKAHLLQSKEAAATDEALGLFDEYVKLLDAEGQMVESWSQEDLKTPEKVAGVLEERRQLRRDYLGDELSQAFYAEQEQYEGYQLEKMRIGMDASLSAEEKAAAAAEAENMLTPEQRRIRQETFAWLDIKQAARQAVGSMDATAADAIRQRFGDKALDRLAAVEQEKDDWENKRKAWLEERARIGARKDLSAAEKQSLLKTYADAHLDQSEQRRMKALDSEAM